MLNKDTVSLNIANSLDQKTADELLQPDKLAGLRNRRFKKIGTLDKRPGQLALSTTQSTSYPTPLAIQAPTNKNTLSSLKDQLTLDNRGAFYARQDDEATWRFVNHSGYVPATSEPIYSGDSSVVTVDSAVTGGFTIVASIQIAAETTTYSGGRDLTGRALRYSVIDNSTGIYVVKNLVLETYSSSGAFIGARSLRVVVVSSRAYILFAVTNTNLLKIVEITLPTGVAGSITTLKSDFVSSDYRSAFDAITVNTNTALGSVIVCAYPRVTDVNVFLIDSSGAALAVPAPVNTGEPNYDGISLFTDSTISVNRFYLAYQTNTTNDPIRSVAYDISAATLTATYALKTVTTTTKMYNSFAQQRNPISGDVVIFFDSYGDRYIINGPDGPQGKPYYSQLTEIAALDYAEITPTGTITTALGNYSIGLRLAAKPFIDLDRSTILIPGFHDSQTTSNFTLCDFLRGKTPKTFFAVTKWYDGLAQGVKVVPYTEGNIFSMQKISDTEFSFVSLYKETLLGETKYLAPLLTTPPDPALTAVVQDFALFDYGISKHTLKLDYAAAESTNVVNDALLSSGGFLQSYDGSTMAEKNFFVPPENVWADIGTSPVTMTQVAGSVSVNQSTTLVMKAGPMWRFAASGGTPYFTFTNPGPALHRVYYIIDGNGTATTGAWVTISVSISLTDSPADIVFKTYKAIKAASSSTIVKISSTKYNGDTLFVQAPSPAVVTSSTVVNMNSNATTAIPAGSYQYVAVWRWVDQQGRLHRSAPSVPVTAVSPGGTTAIGSILVSCPPMTNKAVGDCTVEFYRTLVNGTTFFLLPVNTYGSYTSIPWSSTGRVFLIDGVQDSEIADNEILYTQGGVLPNYGIGTTRHLCTHQKRVHAVAEDGRTILFSKELVEGVPVEFSQELQIIVNNDDADITGIASLDDKLIIGKPNRLYVVAGQYPNDLGTQSSLSQPQEIQGDTGIESHNSIVRYPDGIIFKSKKGFYRLSRALQVDYIGMSVEDYNNFTVSRGVLDQLNNEISFYFQDSAEKIVYNYLQDKWSVWDNSTADDACNHQNAVYRVEHSGKVHKQVEGSFKDIDGATEAYYSSEVELPWLKLKGLQDFQRIFMAALLGVYKSPHSMVATFTYDYDNNVTKTYTVNSSQIINGSLVSDSVYQWEIKPEIQKCQSLKIKFVETPTSGSGESLQMTDVSFAVGLKRGLNKLKAAKRA